MPVCGRLFELKKKKKKKKKMEKSVFWVMTLAVYYSYFESLVGYRNALRSRLGTVSAPSLHIESLPTLLMHQNYSDL